VLAALGVEGVLAHAGEREPLGAFYTLPLFGGVALYLAGQLLFKRHVHSVLSLPRLVVACMLVAALPAAVLVPPRPVIGWRAHPGRHGRHIRRMGAGRSRTLRRSAVAARGLKMLTATPSFWAASRQSDKARS
jgi:hypothetical protein